MFRGSPAWASSANRPIDDQHRMGAGIDGGTDLDEVRRHGVGVPHQGMTSPAPFPFAGQIAPKI